MKVEKDTYNILRIHCLGTELVCNSGADEILFYSMPGGSRLIVDHPVRDEWSNSTTILGRFLLLDIFLYLTIVDDLHRGIWPAGSDITDINSAHVHPKQSLIATGALLLLLVLYNTTSFR